MKFPVYSVLAVMFCGFTFIMYIMFTNVYHNPTNGVFTMMDDMRNLMNTDYSTWTKSVLDNNRMLWGSVFAFGMVMIPVGIFIDIMRKPSQGVE